MRPRFGPAIAVRPAESTAGPSRWTHRVGGVWATCGTVTPTWNAIGLSLPVVLDAIDAIGSLSPWHSFLPPRGGGDTEYATGLCRRCYCHKRNSILGKCAVHP